MADLGLMSGIAGALSGYREGYDTERRYLDQKKKDADELAIKKLLAKSQEVEAAGKLIDVTGDYPQGLFGDDVDKAFGKGGQDQSQQQGQGLLSPQKPGLIQSPSQDQPQQQPQQGLLNSSAQPQTPGLLQKPAQPAQGQSQTAIQGDAGFLTRPINTPYMPKHVRDGIKEATQLSAQNYGKGVVYKYDPDARVVRQFAAPRSELAQAELDKNNAQVKNDRLKPELDTQAEYEKQKSVQDVKETAFNYAKMVDYAKRIQSGAKPSPIADKGLVYNYIRLENPGAVAREGSLEDLRNIPGISNAYGDMISQALKGTLSDTTRNDMLRSASSVYNGVRSLHKDVISKYSDLAKQRGISPTFLKEPELDRLDKDSARMLKQLGPYVQATDRPGIMAKIGSVAGRLLTPGASSSVAAPNPTPNLSAEDQQAIEWAQANPKDPRSAKILQLHGMQ